MKNLFFIFLAVMSVHISRSQAPALIPYQAVARDGSGQPLANATLNARFTIHDNTATGASVWQELQTVSTSALGLFTAQLGSVSPLMSVNWGNGSKFMQVEINAGNGFVDMGTTQLLSVPYALHTKNVSVHVSAIGDTLFLGEEQYVVIPGISEANTQVPLVDSTAHTCGTEGVHNGSLNYATMTDQEGNVYKTMVIGTQEWMAENLNTSVYRNGDEILAQLSDSEWGQTDITMSGAWSYLEANESNACPYGKLYNWFACTDMRGLCPVGWHIPSDSEWNTLTTFLGSSALAGGKMKSVVLWNAPNTGAQNTSGFSALPGSFRYSGGSYDVPGNVTYWWSSTAASVSAAWVRSVVFNNDDVNRDDLNKRSGFSVRCLRDE